VAGAEASMSLQSSRSAFMVCMDNSAANEFVELWERLVEENQLISCS
jgi:hypothetical protein